jgi:hypothetical protein
MRFAFECCCEESILGSCTTEQTCLQDKQRSDSMEPACDAANLHGLLRRAIGILRGIEILLTDETFKFSVLSPIPILKITEKCASLLVPN